MKNKTLVLGASLKPYRYSNLVIQELVNHGISVEAFGLNEGVVAGIHIDSELKFYENVDTITLYINRVRQKDFYDYIISLNPNRVIFNPGTENPEFYKILEENSIYFEEACSLTLLATNQY